MNQKGTTFVDFLIQLIFIIIFVILLVWLFPTKDWLKENYFGSSYIEKETTVSDEKFVTNINNMLEASKNYFGYYVNLPEDIDDSVKVTLDELVDNHLMIMPKDSKGNKCDGDSYAIITKTEVGYTIKVDLTCGSDNDYIIRTVGCDPFCQGSCTQKCTLEYQYSKKVDGYFTNWSSWSAWEVNKKTESEYLKVEKKDFTSKICPSGYELNSDKSACIKKVNEDVTVSAENVKSCPSGYEFNSDKSLCVRNISSKEEVDALVSYSCNSGYTLEGNKCVKKVSSSETISASINYSCSSGNLSGNKCYRTDTVSSNKTSKKTCMSGYTYIGSSQCQRVSTSVIGAKVSGEKCSISYEFDCDNTCKTVAKETCVVPAGTSYSYSCPSGYTLSGDKSYCSKVSVTDASISYSCLSGELSGNKCIITNTTTDTVDANVSYSCSSGKLSGNKCIIDNSSKETTDVIISYVCQEGTLKDDKCVIVKESTESVKYTLKTVTMYRYSTRKYVKESISYKWSTSKEDSKLIKSGYSLTGTTRKNCD